MKRTFMDEDMIGNVSHNPRTSNHHHVAKHRQRNKALEVVFDPTSHKEYITGFRKRKQQRRKEALSALEKRQRQQRLEERAERRQSIRQQLQLEEHGDLTDKKSTVAKSSTAINSDVQVFSHANGMTSTVIIEPIGADSDEEPLRDFLNLGGPPGGTRPLRIGTEDEQQVQDEGVSKEAPEKVSEPQRMGTKKLSKQSLKIMERTKLKLQGKHLKRTKKSTNEKHSKNIKKRKGRH